MDNWFNLNIDESNSSSGSATDGKQPLFLTNNSLTSSKNSIDYETMLTEDDAGRENGGGELRLRKWLFRVHQSDKLKNNEVVCVTGNVEQLGLWSFEKAVVLIQESENVWSKVIGVPLNDTSVQFRYCVCVISETGHLVMVRSWEAHIRPRYIEKNSKCRTFKEPHVYGEYDGYRRIDRGWLNNETVVQFKLFNSSLTLWSRKYTNRRIFIKVTAVSLQKNALDKPPAMLETLDESLSADTQDQFDFPKYAFTEVANLNAADSSFQPQPQFGSEYKENEMLIFQTNVLVFSNLAFLVDYYASKSLFDEEPPVHIGFSYVLPSSFLHSEGQIVMPVTSIKHFALGQLQLEYLVIRPLAMISCDMEKTYARYWKTSRYGLDVGHRGLGTSFKNETKNCSEVRENTIASLKTAASFGADYVEFDVQLSKDLVPVVYHDFHVCISLKKKKDLDEMDVLELPVKDLTLEQLHCLKIYNLAEGRSKNPKKFDEDSEEHQPFPTLQHILEAIDTHVGFNVEIKWNMRLKDGTFELNNPFDVNMYIDTILDVVLKYGGERRVIFSCFNPDICSMIRMKQNKYPVMFLTQGQTSRYPIYHDPRCFDIHSAVKFATSAEILGINVHTEDLLRDGSLVKLAFDASLILFCWGEDNNDPATIKYLKQLGLHGVIYDKIDQYKEAKESIFLVEARDTRKQIILLAAASSSESANGASNTNDNSPTSITSNVENIHLQSSLESLASDC